MNARNHAVDCCCERDAKSHKFMHRGILGLSVILQQATTICGALPNTWQLAALQGLRSSSGRAAARLSSGNYCFQFDTLFNLKYSFFFNRHKPPFSLLQATDILCLLYASCAVFITRIPSRVKHGKRLDLSFVLRNHESIQAITKEIGNQQCGDAPILFCCLFVCTLPYAPAIYIQMKLFKDLRLLLVSIYSLNLAFQAYLQTIRATLPVSKPSNLGMDSGPTHPERFSSLAFLWPPNDAL